TGANENPHGVLIIAGPNPKFEYRNPKQTRNSKSQTRNPILQVIVWCFGFRICFGFRYSDFGFRRRCSSPAALSERGAAAGTVPDSRGCPNPLRGCCSRGP